MKNNELEEQCIHHLNVIKYLVLMSMSILRKGLKVRNYKSWFMQSVINKELNVSEGDLG